MTHSQVPILSLAETRSLTTDQSEKWRGQMKRRADEQRTEYRGSQRVGERRRRRRWMAASAALLEWGRLESWKTETEGETAERMTR